MPATLLRELQRCGRQRCMRVATFTRVNVASTAATLPEAARLPASLPATLPTAGSQRCRPGRERCASQQRCWAAATFTQGKRCRSGCGNVAAGRNVAAPRATSTRCGARWAKKRKKLNHPKDPYKSRRQARSRHRTDYSACPIGLGRQDTAHTES